MSLIFLILERTTQWLTTKLWMLFYIFIVLFQAFYLFRWRQKTFPRLYNNDVVCNLNVDPCKCQSYFSGIFTSSIIYSRGCIRNDQFDGIYRAYQARGYKVNRLKTKDSKYKPLNYRLEPNMVDTNTNMCFNDTFLFVMILVRQNDINRRMLFRENMKRGLVEGKRVDYGFFMVADKENVAILQSVTSENREFHDIIYSQQKDTHTNVTLTVLDSFLWIRDHCPARFVIRLDADCFLHVRNAVKYLSSVNKRFFYGGHPWRAALSSNKDKKTEYNASVDYLGQKDVYNSVLGGGYIVSAAVVPYINIGTLYQELMIHEAEDIHIGRLLENVGIYPISKSWKFRLFVDLTLNKKLRNLSKWPKNVIIVHNLNNFTFQQQVFAHFNSIRFSVCNKKRQYYRRRLLSYLRGLTSKEIKPFLLLIFKICILRNLLSFALDCFCFTIRYCK